jgi:hypothetical protein
MDQQLAASPQQEKVQHRCSTRPRQLLRPSGPLFSNPEVAAIASWEKKNESCICSFSGFFFSWELLLLSEIDRLCTTHCTAQLT